MLKNNPFQILCDFIQNYVQRFVLYMLDHYGILVSRWGWFIVIMDTTIIMYKRVVLPVLKVEPIEPIGLVITLLLSYYIFRIVNKQLTLEKERNFKSYEYHRSRWDNLLFKSIMLFLMLWILPNRFISAFNEYSIVEVVLAFYSVFSMHLLFFVICYTRDREPPAQANLSFAS